MEHIEIMVVVLTIACILVIFLVKRCLYLYGLISKEDIYYKHWRDLYNGTSKLLLAPEIHSGQNYQIAEAFRHLQISVDKLNLFSPVKVVSAETILQYAFKLLSDKDALNELIDSTIHREHNFVASCLKDASPMLAPNVEHGRTFVKLFCQNLKSNQYLCYSAIDEAHSCLEYFEWTIGKMIRLVKKNVKMVEKIVFSEKCLKISVLKVMRHICSFFGDETGLKSYSYGVKIELFNILNQARIKKTIALDTEIVRAGYKGCIDVVSRVSLVDKKHCIYDKFVKPIGPVTDYRIVSSVNDVDHTEPEEFSTVQKEVAELIQSRILVGYDLEKDLRVLNLEHPEEDIRDTAVYPPFRKAQQQKPSLRKLSKEYLYRDLENCEQSSLEDVVVARDLYLKFAEQWEHMVQNMGHKATQDTGDAEPLWPPHVYRQGGSRRPQDIDGWKLMQHFKQQGYIFRD